MQATLGRLQWHRGTKRPHPPESPHRDPRFEPTSRALADPPTAGGAAPRTAFPLFADPSPPHRRLSAGAAAPHRTASPRLSGMPHDAARPERLYCSSPFPEGLAAAVQSALNRGGRGPDSEAGGVLGATWQGMHSVLGGAELTRAADALMHPLSQSPPLAPGGFAQALLHAGDAGTRQQDVPLGRTQSEAAAPPDGAAAAQAWLWNAARASWPPQRSPRPPSPAAAPSSPPAFTASGSRCSMNDVLLWSECAAMAANAGQPEPPYPAAADIPEPIRAWHDAQQHPLVPVVRWALLNLQGLMQSPKPQLHAFVVALDHATHDAVTRREQGLPLVSLHELFSLPLRLPTIVFAAQRRRVSIGGSLPPLHPTEHPPPRTTVVSCLVCNDERAEQVTRDNVDDIFRKLPPYAATAGIPHLTVLLGLRYCADGGAAGVRSLRASDAGSAPAPSEPPRAGAVPRSAQEHDLDTPEGISEAARYLIAHLGAEAPHISVAPVVSPPPSGLRPLITELNSSADAAWRTAASDAFAALPGFSASRASTSTAALGLHRTAPGVAQLDPLLWTGADSEPRRRAAFDLRCVVNPDKRTSERSGSSARRLSATGAPDSAASSGLDSHAPPSRPRRSAVNLLEGFLPQAGALGGASLPRAPPAAHAMPPPQLPPLPPLHPAGPAPPPPLHMSLPGSAALAAAAQAVWEARHDAPPTSSGPGPS